MNGRFRPGLIIGLLMIGLSLIKLVLSHDSLHALVHFWLGVCLVLHSLRLNTSRDPVQRWGPLLYYGSILIFILFLILDIKQNIIGF